MKFIIVSHLYLFYLLNIKCEGKKVSVLLKIKDDWEGKREFIYLKNVELKKRFVLTKNLNRSYKRGDYLYNNTWSFLEIKVNPVENVFNTELNKKSKYISQLKRKVLIEIANNEIIQTFLPIMEKQVIMILFEYRQKSW